MNNSLVKKVLFSNTDVFVFFTYKRNCWVQLDVLLLVANPFSFSMIIQIMSVCTLIIHNGHDDTTQFIPFDFN